MAAPSCGSRADSTLAETFEACPRSVSRSLDESGEHGSGLGPLANEKRTDASHVITRLS